MERKTEKLSEELYEKLSKLDTDGNNIINKLGTIELDIYSLESKIENLKSEKNKLLNQHSIITKEIEIELKSLKYTYKNAVIDLSKGTIESDI